MSKPSYLGDAHKHKICVICEGFEDHGYFERLLKLGVWNPTYKFTLINAKTATKIPAIFQNIYQNDSYEIVLIFCDTDKYPHKVYNDVKDKINSFFNKRKATDRLVIFANPCTMQIILSHFDEVSLKNQGKKTNAAVIKKLTGVSNYDAKAEQIKTICDQILRRTYESMKQRIREMNLPDTESGSTNFIIFIDRFESDDTKWISEIQTFLRKQQS